MAMVLMDRQDYTNKAHQLLEDTNTYKATPKDPTNKLINKLAQTLRDIKTKRELSDSIYKRLYPAKVVAHKFYDLPKIHKSSPLYLVQGPSHVGWPRNWLWSSVPWLASPHVTLKIPQHFVDQVKKVKLEPGEVMASNDVKTLFTSIPMDLSTTIVKCKLQQDPLLSQRKIIDLEIH